MAIYRTGVRTSPMLLWVLAAFAYSFATLVYAKHSNKDKECQCNSAWTCVIDEMEYYPVSHFLTPFFFTMFLHYPLLIVVFFYTWELFEWLYVTSAHSFSGLFDGDNSSGPDNLISDALLGTLGVSMAALVLHITRAPAPYIVLPSSYIKSRFVWREVRIVVWRLIQAALMTPPTFFINHRSDGVPAGLIILMVVHLVLWCIWGAINSLGAGWVDLHDCFLYDKGKRGGRVFNKKMADEDNGNGRQIRAPFVDRKYRMTRSIVKRHVGMTILVFFLLLAFYANMFSRYVSVFWLVIINVGVWSILLLPVWLLRNYLFPKFTAPDLILE